METLVLLIISAYLVWSCFAVKFWFEYGFKEIMADPFPFGIWALLTGVVLITIIILICFIWNPGELLFNLPEKTE